LFVPPTTSLYHYAHIFVIPDNLGSMNFILVKGRTIICFRNISYFYTWKYSYLYTWVCVCVVWVRVCVCVCVCDQVRTVLAVVCQKRCDAKTLNGPRRYSVAKFVGCILPIMAPLLLFIITTYWREHNGNQFWLRVLRHML